MHIKFPAKMPKGQTVITKMGEIHPQMLMNFSILRLDSNESYTNETSLERAYLLIKGNITIKWAGISKYISRENCFDFNPWVLHVTSGEKVEIISHQDETEISIIETDNEKKIKSKLYSPEEVRQEERGKGTLNETSTRIVRTVFDKSNSIDSNLVVGEVIDMPGKWSSYPPHYHPQPEIYYYKFNPQGGFGYCELGEDVVKVRNNSTTLIGENLTHPQTTAPGYAMWYLWAIRHLDNNSYITPTFLPEHLWVNEKDAKIWEYKK